MPENAFLKRSFWKTLHRSNCREQIPPPMGSTCALSLLLYSVYGHFLTPLFLQRLLLSITVWPAASLSHPHIPACQAAQTYYACSFLRQAG